jgi:hypothetical protein
LKRAVNGNLQESATATVTHDIAEEVARIVFHPRGILNAQRVNIFDEFARQRGERDISVSKAQRKMVS